MYSGNRQGLLRAGSERRFDDISLAVYQITIETSPTTHPLFMI